MHNLKIRTKLAILVIFSSLLLVGVGVAGLFGINSANTALASMYNNRMAAINQLNEVRNHQMQIRIGLLAARQETDAFEILAYTDKVRSHIFQVDQFLTAYSTRPVAAEEKKLLDAFVAARMNFGATGVIPMIDLLSGEKFAEADKLRKEALDPAYAKASDSIDTLLVYQVNTAKGEYDHITHNAKTIRIASIASIGVGLILTILFGFVITRSVNRGVSALEQAASRLAAGDLTTRAPDSRDELGEVARAFNQMANEFSNLINQVHNSSDHVSDAAGQLSNIADRVALGSKNQSEQAAIAATSVENLNLAVQEVANTAQDIVAAASEASAMAEKGNQIVNNAVQGIQQVAHSVGETSGMISALGQRSHQIGQILKVIKDIADQTNLLALNAAIEAARAGEQGRGFAVVADEVRKLAERTANATSEISGMINAIQSETGNAVTTMAKSSVQVQQGVELANQAGQSLQQINHSVKRVVSMIRQIATTTSGQTEFSQGITTRVERIAQMAVENSASIEQTSQATHELLQLSSNLQQVVSRFKL